MSKVTPVLFIVILLCSCSAIRHEAHDIEGFIELQKPRVRFEYIRQINQQPNFKREIEFRVGYDLDGYLESCEILNYSNEMAEFKSRVCDNVFNKIKFKHEKHRVFLAPFIYAEGEVD